MIPSKWTELIAGLALCLVPSACGPGISLPGSAAAFNYNGRLLVVGTGTGVALSMDDGERFIVKTQGDGLCPGPYTNIRGSGQRLLVAGGGGLSISTNRGRSFTCKNILNGTAWAFDSGKGLYYSSSMIIVGSVATSGLSISTDGGASWINRTAANSTLYSDTASGVSVLGSTIYVASNSGVSYSTNGGTNFTGVANLTAGLGGMPITSVTDNGTYVFIGTNTGVSYTTGGGAFTTAATTGSVIDVYARGNTVLAATNNGLAITSNITGGTFVTKTTADGLASNALTAVTAIPEGTAIFAGSAMGISKSINSGTSFITRDMTNGLPENMVNALYYLVP